MISKHKVRTMRGLIETAAAFAERNKQALGGDPALIDQLIRLAEELDMSLGMQFLCGACGDDRWDPNTSKCLNYNCESNT